MTSSDWSSASTPALPACSRNLRGAADKPARLGALWAELCDVLLAHLGAFEEVFLLPLLGAVTDWSLSMEQRNAQKLDVLDAVAEAHVQPTGSPLVTDGVPRFGPQAPEWIR